MKGFFGRIKLIENLNQISGGIQMRNSDFFFCYNAKLYKYLTREKGIPYVTTAKNAKDDRIFTLFYRTDQLADAIKEYRQTYNI